jgi:rhodanese-related sulfurtransferase
VIRVIKTVFLLAFICSLYACVNSAKNDQPRFITRDGLEPDRWASVWLVKTMIAPEAEVIIRPSESLPGKPLPNKAGELGDATSFAVPESAYKRTSSSTAFSSLIEGYHLIDDPALKRMSALLTAIETASWSIEGSEADAVEQSFRRLQERHERIDVPVSCYMRFFDQFYQRLKNSDKPLKADNLETASTCATAPLADVKREKQHSVSQIATHELLDEIAAGKNIIFVDAREPEEFQELRIPGAINISLRDVATVDLKTFHTADRVISYCIKDFRGYEVARALASKGVKNSSTMKPYGLAGWKSLGLPVTVQGQDDNRGVSKLSRGNALLAGSSG